MCLAPAGSRQASLRRPYIPRTYFQGSLLLGLHDGTRRQRERYRRASIRCSHMNPGVPSASNSRSMAPDLNQ